MSTTEAKLAAGGGKPVWVVAIEGVDYLLSDTADTAAVLTAWAATPWAACKGGGLKIEGEFKQSIEPWNPNLSPPEIDIIITPVAGDDTFGIEVHKGGAGNETFLEAAVDPEDASIVGLNGDDFGDGDIYMGLERSPITGAPAADTFTVVTDGGVVQRGVYAPFSYDGGTNIWGRPHALSSADFGVRSKPVIRDAPRAWIGKWVSVTLHMNQGGVLNLKADALLVFAGKIDQILDTSEGDTKVHCVDVRETLKTTTLMHDQFQGRVAEGVYLTQGLYFDARASYSNGGLLVLNDATRLLIGTDIPAGFYTREELFDALNEWLSGDATIANAGTWSVALQPGSDASEYRVVFACSPASGNSIMMISIYMPNWIWQYLGWDITNYGNEWKSSATSDEDSVQLIAPKAPYISMGAINAGPNHNIFIGDTRGAWVNNQSWLPASLRDEYTVAGENWGLIQIGGSIIALAKYNDGETFSNVRDVTQLIVTGSRALTVVGQRMGTAPALVAKQVVLLSGSFRDIIARFFATTGATSNWNHGTYDESGWGAQLGAAIPWELLGIPFLSSLDLLSQSTQVGGLEILIEKPTRLWDAIEADLVLRGAWLVWDSGAGGLRFVSPQTPSSIAAIHTLTETNKASAERNDPQRSPTWTTHEYLANVLKVFYDRDPLAGESDYLRDVEARWQSSIDDHGETKPITIKARNTSQAVADSLIADVIAKLMPLYGRPLKIMERAIDLSLFSSLIPGDVVVVNDDHARDPDTGQRRLSSKPALVLEQSHNYGGNGGDMVGEVKLIFQDLDLATRYSPSALVASYAASVFTVAEHEYSETGDPADASNFEASDAIEVQEIDPDDPAAPQIHATTIASVLGNDITVDDAFAGYDAGKTYRIVSADYTTAQSSQDLDCYLADDADGKIQDGPNAYTYADIWPLFTWTPGDATDLAERHANVMTDEGEPVAAGYGVAMARNINNLVSYSTAPQAPQLFAEVKTIGGEDWQAIRTYPYYIGPGFIFGGLTRALTIAVAAYSSNAGDGIAVRVTVSQQPPIGTSLTAVEFGGTHHQLTFSTSSATPAVLTAQTTTIIGNVNTGVGFVTIEARATAAHGADAKVWGIAEFWLGPLVEL